MTTDGWLWDAALNCWWHPQTYVLILDEDMPWELTPRCAHTQPVLPWLLPVVASNVRNTLNWRHHDRLPNL